MARKVMVVVKWPKKLAAEFKREARRMGFSGAGFVAHLFALYMDRPPSNLLKGFNFRPVVQKR